MALRRRIETRTETFLGEELVYAVEVWEEKLPAPYQYTDGPIDATGVRPARATFVKDQGWVGTAVREEPTRVRPRKAAYLGAFARAGVTAFVAATVARVGEAVRAVADHFDLARSRAPRRLRQALGRFRPGDLLSAYDAATLARIAWHFARHRARAERAALADLA